MAGPLPDGIVDPHIHQWDIDKPVQTIPASVEVLTTVLGDGTDLSLLLRDVARRTYRL